MFATPSLIPFERGMTMSTPPAAKLPPEFTGSGPADDVASPLEEATEQRHDQIEMTGKEEAAGLPPPGHSEVSAGMRYLHCSRTIHQLVSDRNRAVGLYLAVASLLWTASTALLNIQPENVPHLIVPI